MAIKLQLDYPALEKLLGGNSELELDLRKGIAESFGKNYIKSLANSEMASIIRGEISKEMNSTRSSITSLVDEYLKKNFDTDGYSWNPKITIKDSYRKVIRDTIQSEFNAILTTKLGELQTSLESFIKEREPIFQKYIDKLTTAYIDQAVKKKFEEALASTKL